MSILKIIKYLIILLILILILYNLFKYSDNYTNILLNEENNCEYVSSRGILKSCDIKNIDPRSSNSSLENNNLHNIVNNSIVYICNTAIPNFIKYFSTIDKKIILVSGDSDETVYEDLFDSYNDFLNFIESDKIIVWFSQNCTIKHNKIQKMPIGLDYHSNQNITNYLNPKQQENMIIDIINNSKKFDQRIIKAYSNFHFFMTTKYGYDRLDAYHNIPRELVYYENQRTERELTYYFQSKFAFVISPHGNGYDCHRTWEALILGCIPIVKTSNLDELYDDLPVLIVKFWSDISYELLVNTIINFKNKNFNYDKLKLKYWINKINSYKI
jgi:hypothetical protein